MPRTYTTAAILPDIILLIYTLFTLDPAKLQSTTKAAAKSIRTPILSEKTPPNFDIFSRLYYKNPLYFSTQLIPNRMGPYTSNVRKAQYLIYCKCRKSRREVAKLYNLAKLTAADIQKRSLKVKEERLAASLLPPKIKDLVSVKKKSGRPLVLLVNDVIEIFKACILNKENYKKQQHYVAVEEGFKACRRTIKTRL